MQSSRTNTAFWGYDPRQKLYVRSYGDFILVPDDAEQNRTVDFGEIFWPVSGRGTFRLNSRDWILKPGYAWYYPPGSYHQYRPLDVFHYCWLTVAGEHAKTFFNILGLVPGLNRAGRCPTHLFALLANDLENHTAMHRTNALNTAFQIINQIPLGRHSYSRPEKSMVEVRNMIDWTYADPDLSVARLAKNLNMHRGSLSRGFSKTYGTTVSDYIIHTRLQAAMNMLRKSSIPIMEIAESCGFHSSNYFSKVFFAKIGFTPKSYREKYSGEQITGQ
jgi:AraC-like DNA-binding protein